MMLHNNSNHQKQQQHEEGNLSKSIEDLEKQSSKLDPSLLLHFNMNNRPTIEDQQKCGMILRRRGVLCQYSAKHETISFPFNSTFSPKEEVRNDDYNDETTKKKEQRNQTTKSKTDISRKDGYTTNQSKSKIFSITTSSFLLIATITLLGIFCFCLCNRASLLVNAQYSNFEQNQKGSNSNNNNVKPKMTRQQIHDSQQHSAGYSGNQSPSIVTSESTSTSTPTSRSNSRSNSIPDTQSETQLPAPISASNKAYQHQLQLQNSIDRFDSGEQIRAPSLRKQSTLQKPHTSPQQVSSNKAYNLQTAASQESYLSPDDREQLLKSHENHYEGRNYDQQSPNDAQLPEREQYEKPNRWSQPDSSSPYDLGSARSNNLELHASKFNKNQQPSQGSATNADNEDSDYEDEPHEGLDQKRANNVPEIRRPTGSASYNHAQRQYGRPDSGAAVSNAAPEGNGSEDGEPSDDYGGANDEAHFSRMSNQQGERSSLNPSASYNQQSRKAQKKPFSPSNKKGHGGGRNNYNNNNGNNNNNNEGQSEEHNSFGPGPNEAYMFDRAESGKPSADHEEEGMNLGTGGDPPSDSSSSNDEGNSRFDRRSQNQYLEGSTSNTLPQGSPVNYDKPLRPIANLNTNENNDSDESDENGEINDDSGPAFASSKAESKARMNPINYGPRISNVSPKTSASAPAPLSTLSSSSHSGSQPTYSLPISITPASYKSSIISSQQPFQRQQAHNQHLPNHQVNNMMTLSSNNQNKATKMPYNPQDNPSHAGKYFIN